MRNETDEVLYPPLQGGAFVGLSGSTLKYLYRIGRLPGIKTAGGQHLFRKSDLEKLRDQRAAEKKQDN